MSLQPFNGPRRAHQLIWTCLKDIKQSNVMHGETGSLSHLLSSNSILYQSISPALGAFVNRESRSQVETEEGSLPLSHRAKLYASRRRSQLEIQQDAVCSKQITYRSRCFGWASRLSAGRKKAFRNAAWGAIDPLDGRTRKDGSIGFTKD